MVYINEAVQSIVISLLRVGLILVTCQMTTVVSQLSVVSLAEGATACQALGHYSFT